MHRFVFILAFLTFLAPAVSGFCQEAPAPLPPEEAAQRMSLPEGFRATVFAAEPDIVQPIAVTTDDRGRLWVVECVSYPNWIPAGKDGKEGSDRILIFEDRDGDGRFDSRKVFYDKGANFAGMELGFGGVWVCATPYLLFIPDRDGDDVPDRGPEVILDGWDLSAKHNVFNGLAWGPDGWLYGMNGILSNSNVGKPGTPDDQRVPLNCGVWRFHPTRRVFETVANGTTNPWGLDFDDFGQMFITNCVIQHLFHVIPGAHFKRMFGQDFNPNLYGLIESCADHIHWAGGPWQSSREGKGKHGEAGGGHAHAGAMVYLGDNWPDRYRNSVFTCNIHGNRVNRDTLKHEGSGYVAQHASDFLMANDTWFRGLNLIYGPDGGVFVTDWSDTGECHDYDHSDRTNGRIYKITYGNASAAQNGRKDGSQSLDLNRLSDAELVKLQLHKNDWYVRHARRILWERAAAGKLVGTTVPALLKLLREAPDVTRRLRALWTLHGTRSLDDKVISELLDSREEYIRGWAIQLQLEDRELSDSMLSKLVEMSLRDPSPVVRLYLASGLQRLPAEKRWPIAEGLVTHAEDAQDSNLPLMIWYGIEPLMPADKERALSLIVKTKIPLVREYIARRLASMATLKAEG